MNKNYDAQKRYRKKNVVTRYIDFYPKDMELLDLSKTINFQQFVKQCLKNYKTISNELYYCMHEGVENGK